MSDTPQAPSKSAPLAVIQVRSDFLKAASARRQAAGSFLLQARDRRDGESVTRIGFTASKKVGNAVARNRAKRRMREVARAILPRLGQAGWDYVLVARPGVTNERDFATLLQDFEAAITAIHRPPRASKPAPQKPAVASEGNAG